MLYVDANPPKIIPSIQVHIHIFYFCRCEIQPSSSSFSLSFRLLRAISKGSMWASRIGSTTPVEPWRASLVRHLRNVKPAAFRSFISHPPHFGGSSIVWPVGPKRRYGGRETPCSHRKKLHSSVCCLFATVLVQHSTTQYQHMEELIRRSALHKTKATSSVASKNNTNPGPMTIVQDP